MDKYMPNTTVTNWFRLASHKQTSASRIWNSLIKSVHVITHWLSWLPGSGHLISISRDRILGLGDSSFLSDALITLLRQQRITVLAQAKGSQDHFTYSENWICSEELGITGNLATEWVCYHRALIGVGVTIQDTTDTLIWIGGDSSGTISVKNIYSSLISAQRYLTCGGWR
jgi:hypothetical protein